VLCVSNQKCKMETYCYLLKMLRCFNCTMHSNKVFSYQQMTRLKTTLSRLLVSTTKQAVNRSTSVNTKYIFSAQHSDNKDEGHPALERRKKNTVLFLTAKKITRSTFFVSVFFAFLYTLVLSTDRSSRNKIVNTRCDHSA
jgi:hypothetical protein